MNLLDLIALILESTISHKCSHRSLVMGQSISVSRRFINKDLDFGTSFNEIPHECKNV
jgi:hypothetical protein